MVPPGDIGPIPIWIVVYLGLLVAGAIASYVLYRRVVWLVLQGRSTPRFDRPFERLKGAALIVLGQRRVLQRVPQRDWAGIGHALIFWGFLSFTLSYVIFIFGASIWSHFPEWLLTPLGVRVYSTYLDLLAALLLVLLAWALLRRWVVRPHRLSFDLTRNLDSVIIVAMIAGLMVSTLLTHAFHVAAGGAGPEAEVFIGQALGNLLSGIGVSQGAASILQGVFWWLHVAIILGFTVYIPFSKHMHMIAAPANAFFRNLDSRGALEPIELETAERFGAGRVQDLTWKQLLDGYACAVCGRCTAACPANLTGKVLSPMHIVENLKDHMIAIGHQGERNPEHVEPVPLVGGAIPEQAIWDCLSCGACMEECPVVVEHVPTILDMRRFLVLEESRIPETAMNALLSLEQRGHPWRGTQYSRTDWTEGLNVPTLSEKPDAEVLFWVGCTGALEQRSQGVARSMVKVLKSAGVDFAILGDEESCTGDPARRMGNEYLFQILAGQAIETLNTYGVKKIVTICPHCFNTMRNEYPQFRRRLRSAALQPIRGRVGVPGQSEAREDDERLSRVSRLLLPGAAQRHLRPAAEHCPGGPWAHPSGNGASVPGTRLLLRSRRRTHVGGGKRRNPGQPRADRPLPGNRGEHSWRFLSLLPADVDRGHPGQRERRGKRCPRLAGNPGGQSGRLRGRDDAGG